MTKADKVDPDLAIRPDPAFDSIFPFHLILDRELRLIQTGPSLRRACPHLPVGSPLLDSFSVETPGTDGSFESLAAVAGTVVMLQNRANKLVLRGQVMVSEQGDHVIYLGSPWLDTPAAAAELGLRVRHFRRHDAPVGEASSPDRLAELRELGGAELVEELLAEFHIQVKSDLHEIEDAAQASDFQELLRLAHRLKGAATTVGMAAILSLCSELEMAARGQDRRRILNVIERMRSEVEDSRSAAGADTGPSKHIRILIADDHPVVRFGVRRMLQGHAQFMVVGEAADGKEAIHEMREMHPDILLLDLNMPLLPGLETLRELTTSQVPTKTILLTSAISQRQVLEALQLGARGVVLKDAMAVDLASCISAVMSGQYWLGSKPVNNLVQVLNDLMEEIKQPPQNTFGLTARELEVVTYIAQGNTNKDIARECKIAEETVKRHLKNIFDKVGVWNRLELALFAINNHLVGEVTISA
jgi:DNA-binding NarL/FixJ family response regulator/HPt (histidine-containing phosphotransfer) domain-containing protein